jgi:hypothetical protein
LVPKRRAYAISSPDSASNLAGIERKWNWND